MYELFFVSLKTVATSGLTTLAALVVGIGGLLGYYGALVSVRSDRRLTKFLIKQEESISKLPEDPNKSIEE